MVRRHPRTTDVASRQEKFYPGLSILPAWANIGGTLEKMKWSRAPLQAFITDSTQRRQDDPMRKLIFSINVTLDGCCDHTKGMADDELLDYYAQFLRDVGLQVFGRKTYQLMVPYWPDVAKNESEGKASIAFARAFVALQKVVFSRTLDSVEDKNTRIVRGNLRDEILKLKQEKGKNILVGGVDIPSQLIELGLVDEVHLVVQPIIAGEGRRLLDRVSMPKLQLKLVDSKILKSGCVALRYLK